MIKPLYFVRALTILFAVLLPALAQGYANTTPINSGYSNRIIDDSIFLNSGTMSANQIQAFLNSKVPSCDTNHQGGLAQYPPPYTCLKDYVDPTTQKSAAQLIHDEATSIGLNPQVILVTLEKEQGLITDTWPYPSQYRSAMGYGCPESQSVCDSQYYGFYNQVHLGARLLRAGTARNCGDTATLPSWNINAKWRLGSSPVVDGKATYLASCATGSLYNYTPHRPDSAYTLAADGNYYYGNYNFVTFWTSWFGPTVRAYLGRSASSALVYLINDNTKYPIWTLDTLNTFSMFGSVQTYSDGFIAGLATQPNLQRMVVGPNSTVYLLDSGNKIPFGSCALVSEYGYSCGSLVSLPQNVLDGFIASPVATNVIRTNDGSIYKMVAGRKQGVPDMATYVGSGMNQTAATGLGSALASQFPDGPPVLLDNVIAQDYDTGSAYLHIGTSNFPITSFSTYMNWKFDKLPFYRFPGALVNQIPRGGSITSYAQDSGNNKYVLNKGIKLPLAGAASQWTSSYTVLPDSYLSAITAGSTASRVVKGSDSSIYYVEGQQRRPFPSWPDLTNAGFGYSDILTLDDPNLAALSVGPLKLGSLTLFKQASSGSVAMVDGNGAKLLSSAPMASAYGPGLSNVRTVDSATWSAYNPTGLLAQLATDGTNNYLVDGGKKRLFPSGVLADYGYTGSSFQALQAVTVAALPSASDMTVFVRGSGGTIYKIVGGQKRGFSSYAAFTSAGGTSSNTIVLSDFYLASLPTGANLP
jgi:hypothetical protein